LMEEGMLLPGPSLFSDTVPVSDISIAACIHSILYVTSKALRGSGEGRRSQIVVNVVAIIENCLGWRGRVSVSCVHRPSRSRRTPRIHCRR
jgi:hypothetical protein